MIVLFNPWSTPSPKKPLPMSLLAIASMLEGAFDYEIVDGNLVDDPVARIVEIGRQRRLTAIGITVMPGPQLDHAVPASRRLKGALPGVPIVWGGYFPSQHADVCLRAPYVDFCVQSQGERAFLALARVLATGGDPGAIAGVVSRDATGAVHHAPRGPLTPLDDLPDWPYERLPMDRYFHRHYLGARVGAHHSSYGCPFGCNFCAVVGMAKRRWMPQSAARTFGVVRRLHDEYGADAVQFHDMDFFVSEERTSEFSDRMRGLGVAWWALGRVDELMRYRDDTWTRMRRSGLKMVFCGAESGSDAVLRRMNKGGRASAALTLELARRMKHHGIVPEFSFVLGNPPDPETDIAETIGFVRRLKRINADAEIILYNYTPVPLDGTLYDSARALGFAFPESLEEWVAGEWRQFALRRNPQTPWTRPGLQRRIRWFESVLNAYYPTVTDMRLTGARRALLRLLAGWRYRLQWYAWPLELRLLHRWLRYQRPETTGF
ncbi:MAG TPA: radical SAM protein [Vicinamibacterales bacterium]|nr:radical SAM protein [Vicinamibacterales bacterium]